MSENEIKNLKKPVSFKKPIKSEKNFLQNSYDGLRQKKISLHTQIKSLEDEIKLLTQYSSDTIYRLNYSTMKYDYISPAITKLLGFTAQEMKRINFRSLIVETKLVTDGLKKISSFDELENKRKEGDVGKWNADYLIRTKSGNKIWVSDISYPWFDENGKVIGSVGSLRDITERVKIEEKLFSDLQTLSTQDALTGLPGKSNFFASLDKELRRLKRSESVISIVLFEIDNIQKVTSHVGENIIIEIAKIIKNALRDTDSIARIDSGNFAVLLPETDIKSAYYVAERIRGNVIAHKFSIGDVVLNCSISAGIASADADDNLSAADIYKLADTRLFIAKSTGQNQVSIDEIIQMH